MGRRIQVSTTIAVYCNLFIIYLFFVRNVLYVTTTMKSVATLLLWKKEFNFQLICLCRGFSQTIF